MQRLNVYDLRRGQSAAESFGYTPRLFGTVYQWTLNTDAVIRRRKIFLFRQSFLESGLLANYANHIKSNLYSRITT